MGPNTTRTWAIEPQECPLEAKAEKPLREYSLVKGSLPKHPWWKHVMGTMIVPLSTPIVTAR